MAKPTKQYILGENGETWREGGGNASYQYESSESVHPNRGDYERRPRESERETEIRRGAEQVEDRHSRDYWQGKDHSRKANAEAHV